MINLFSRAINKMHPGDRPFVPIIRVIWCDHLDVRTFGAKLIDRNALRSGSA